MALSDDQRAWLARMNALFGRRVTPESRSGPISGGQGSQAGEPHDLSFGYQGATRTAQVASPTPGAPQRQKVKPSKPSSREIKAAQVMINVFRDRVGKPRIPENGVLDPDTIKAIDEFKDANLTRVKGSSSFGKLDPALQAKVLQRIESFAQDVRSLDKIEPLQNLVSAPGFDKLLAPIQKLMLNVHAARPNDAALSDDLRRLLTPSFWDLTVSTQILVLERIHSYGGNRAKISNLVKLISETFFSLVLSKEIQDQLLESLRQNPKDVQLVDILITVVGDSDFSSVVATAQSDLLFQVAGYRGKPDMALSLLRLYANAEFHQINFDVREELLRKLEMRFGGTRLDSSMVRNIVLVTKRGFERVRSDFRELMLDLLAARPGNAQLAENFRQLVESPIIFNPGKAGQAIIDADSKTP
jgi:hypothetical protein